MNEAEDPLPDGRLSPEMASFRLKVLGFVRRYWESYGGSPSYGEIAAGLSTNRERVRKAVKRLVMARQLVRTPGPRGLALPDGKARRAVTNRPLRPRFDLDYIPPGENGAGNGDGSKRAGDAGGAQSAD